MIGAIGKLRSSGLTSRERFEQALAILVDRVFENLDIGMFISTAATEQGKRLNILIERLVCPIMTRLSHCSWMRRFTRVGPKRSRRDVLDAGECHQQDDFIQPRATRSRRCRSAMKISGTLYATSR
jgi:hypothetical protein